MSEQAKLSLNYNGLCFEISGPEAFVAAQAEFFREAITSTLMQAKAAHEEEQVPTLGGSAPGAPQAAPHQQPVDDPMFTNVLHIEGEKVTLLKTPAGSSTAQKACKVVLAYLWAKHQRGVDAVAFPELRRVCKHHGCLDEGNFSKHLKSAKQDFILDGQKGAQTCKLTIGAVQRARTMLEAMNGN